MRKRNFIIIGYALERLKITI